jgi:hypothetical protein
MLLKESINDWVLDKIYETEEQKWYRNWFKVLDIPDKGTFTTRKYVGVTLTMKQYANNKTIDDMISSQNMRHFLNLLNRECFGQKFKRQGKKLKVIPSLEVDKKGRYHYHLVLQNPFSDTPFHFERMIKRLWHKTNYGYVEVEIFDQINFGWVNYITKFNHPKNKIDLENCNI